MKHRPSPVALALAGIVAIFLLAPLISVVPISLTPARFLTMPKGELSLIHYRELINNPDLYNKATSTLNQLSQLVDTVASGKGSIGKLVADDTLYNHVNDTVAKLDKMATSLDEGKGTIGKLTHDQEFAAKLQETINNLAALTTSLEKGEGTAGMLFKDPALYNNSNQMLVETRELVKSIRENPKKYLTFHVKVF